MGEMRYGSAKGAKRALFVCIGTGCGSAFGVDGSLATPGMDGVPESGYIYDAPFLEGCVDDYISRRGLLAFTKQMLGEELDGKALAQRTDAAARACFLTFGERLRDALLPHLKRFQPEVLCLGGQITKSASLFLPPVEELCREIPGTTYLSYEDTDRQLEESYEQIRLLAWGLILFVGLIGLLNIVNTVYTNIHTRVTEIGMQRAIGMSHGALYQTFLWEGAYYGIIAAVIGGMTGYICTIFVEAARTDTIQLVSIPVVSLAEAAVMSVLACLIATCIPLRRIAKMSIVDSIETIE